MKERRGFRNVHRKSYGNPASIVARNHPGPAEDSRHKEDEDAIGGVARHGSLVVHHGVEKDEEGPDDDAQCGIPYEHPFGHHAVGLADDGADDGDSEHGEEEEEASDAGNDAGNVDNVAVFRRVGNEMHRENTVLKEGEHYGDDEEREYKKDFGGFHIFEDFDIKAGERYVTGRFRQSVRRGFRGICMPLSASC